MEIDKINVPQRIFVTGIDTDAGKSYATGILARRLMDAGRSVITQKFIQTGCKDYSEDIEVHRRLMKIPLQTVDITHITAPVLFSYPASPHLAAEIDKRQINLNEIDRATEILASKYQHVLIEGAGGLMVPLKGDYMTIDYIRERQLPALLVTNGRLGSINHTILSLEALAHAGIDIFGVVYNHHFDTDRVIAADTFAYIRHWVASHLPDTLFIGIN